MSSHSGSLPGLASQRRFKPLQAQIPGPGELAGLREVLESDSLFFEPIERFVQEWIMRHD